MSSIVMISTELLQAARILKWLNSNLQMAEISLKYLEKKMMHEYMQEEWDQTELNTLRVTMYCTVNSMLIWYTSFDNEYNRKFHQAAMAHNREQYISLRKVCEDYLDVIQGIFPNLRRIRNTILAHGYRWNDDRTLSDTEIDTFMNEITNTGSLLEYYQLSNISNLILTEIEKVYGEVDALLDVDDPEEQIQE